MTGGGPERDALAGEHDVEQEGSAGYERVVAFSDGVFAIAITLLVLGLEVPDLPDRLAAEELGSAVRELWPQILSYFIGFAVIGAFWLGHHHFFNQLLRFDSTLMKLNLAFLALISLMPFTTGVFGRYGDVEVAVILYAANVVAASALDTAMLWVALRRRLLPDEPDMSDRALLWHNFFPGFVFLLSIPVAVARPTIAPWIWIGLALRGTLTTLIRARR